MATSAVPSLPPLRSPARGTASSASEDRASSPDDVAAAPLTETVAKRQGGMHMFGVKDSQRGLAGVGYVEYRAMYSTPHRGLRPGDIGALPWIVRRRLSCLAAHLPRGSQRSAVIMKPLLHAPPRGSLGRYLSRLMVSWR